MKKSIKGVSFVFVLFLLAVGTANAQIGIGTDTPDASALLDIKNESNENKGLLIPRMDLGDLASASPVIRPKESLLVYNTDLANGGTNAGYYYWHNNAWTPISNPASIGKKGKSTNSSITGFTAANKAFLEELDLKVNVDNETIKINNDEDLANKGKLYVNSVSPKIIDSTIAGAGLVRDAGTGILSVSIGGGAAGGGTGGDGSGSDNTNRGAGQDVTSSDNSIDVTNRFGATFTAMGLKVNVDNKSIKVSDADAILLAGDNPGGEIGDLYVNLKAGGGLSKDSTGALSVSITAGGTTATGVDTATKGAGQNVTSGDSSIDVTKGFGAAFTAMELDVNVDDATIKINDGTTVPADKGKLYVNSVSPKIIGATIAGAGLVRDDDGILSVNITAGGATGTGADVNNPGAGKDVTSDDSSITVANGYGAALTAMKLDVNVDDATIKINDGTTVPAE